MTTTEKPYKKWKGVRIDWGITLNGIQKIQKIVEN